MFNASQLSDDQKSTIHQWASEGAQLFEIQKKIETEFEVSITYMEARFLVLDLNVEIKPLSEEPQEEEEVIEKVATGEVHVSVDSIVRVGAEISGSVEFSDGEKALWAIDSMGRLDLDADEPGYKPSEEDVQKFQDKLREHLQSMQ